MICFIGNTRNYCTICVCYVMVRTKADNFYYKGYRDGAKLKVAMNNNLEMQAMGNGYD